VMHGLQQRVRKCGVPGNILHDTNRMVSLNPTNDVIGYRTVVLGVRYECPKEFKGSNACICDEEALGGAQSFLSVTMRREVPLLHPGLTWTWRACQFWRIKIEDSCTRPDMGLTAHATHINRLKMCRSHQHSSRCCSCHKLYVCTEFVCSIIKAVIDQPAWTHEGHIGDLVGNSGE
jgi:hypothetical protein